MGGSSPNRLTLVVGPANSGKQGVVLDWWQRRLLEKPVVVAPTTPDARQLSLEMAERTGGLVGQDQAVTFDGLVRLVLARPSRYARDIERTLIAARLLNGTRLEALAAHAHLPGAAGGLAGLLEQLRDSGLEPEALDGVLARWATIEPRHASLAADVRRLVKAQQRMYSALGLTDRPAALREAALAAGAWERPVALYGFTSFTPGQRALVEALSRRAEVLVTFTYDHSRDVNVTSPAEIAWWTARAATTEVVAPAERAYTSPAVEYLERHFMGSEARPPAPPAAAGARGKDEGVWFLLASGQRAEAELAAEKIAGLLRDGFRPGEIAVIVRNMRSWGRLLSDVFDSCGIPFHLDDRCLVRETGLGHAFLSALRGVAFDDAQALLAYLRSPYSGLSVAEASDLDLAYRRGTARGARVLAGLAADRGLSSVEGLWAMVERDAVPLHLDVRARIPGSPADTSAGPAPGRDCEVVRFVPAAAEGLARDMLAAGLRGSTVGDRAAREDARAFRALRGAFAAMTALASLDDLAVESGGAPARTGLEQEGSSAWPGPRLVLDSLGRTPVPGDRWEDDDAVQILSVERARARRFQAAVILGLVEGEFPGRPDRPSLLSVDQRARLNEAGGGFLPPDPDCEGGFFVSAISRPWRLLILSSRDADDDGSESVPSHYWQEARRLLGEAECEPECRTLADQVFSPGGAPSLRHYLRACVARGQTPRTSAAGPGRGVTVPPWGRPPLRLTDPAIVGELASTECFSPSSLESYARCPFKWFVEKVVGAEEMDVGLDGRTIGQLLHSVLGETYCALSSAGLLPLKAADMPQAECAARSSIDRQVWGDQCPGTPAERRLAAWRLGRMVRNLFEMEVSAAASLVFLQSEMWVGGHHGVDIGGLKVRGRVDRVDTTPDGNEMFVLDYKTGAIPAAGALGSPEGLQLPLYLLALAAERPDARVIGGAYLSPADKKRAGIVLAGSEWALGSGTQGIRPIGEVDAEALWRATLETASAAAEGIKTGVIAPSDDRSCPAWCALGPACRARRGEYRP